MVPLESRGFVRAPQALVHIEGSATSQLIASFKSVSYGRNHLAMTKNSQNEPPRAHMLAHTPTPDINVPYIVG